MTTNLQQGTLLDVLKKKMRQTKEEMERYKDECEEYNRKHQLEAMRREEVSICHLFIRNHPCDISVTREENPETFREDINSN